MKTTDVTPEGTCPKCKGRVSKDLKGKGFCRHLNRLPNETKCTHGLTEKNYMSPHNEKGV